MGKEQKVPEARHHIRNVGRLYKADRKIYSHPEALAEGSQEIPPRPQGVGESPLSKAYKNHKPHSTHVKRAAFTLAEVLITLGIIGVVAAMTIPTISHNIQEMVLNNQFKKFYSTFKQAFIGVQTMEGRPIKCFYWDENPYAGKCTSKCDTNEFNEFVNCRCEETGEAPPSDYMGLRSECTMLFNEVITNRLKVAKICKDHALEGGCLPEDIRGKDKIREELNPDGNYNPEGEFSDSKIKNVYPVVVLQDGTYIISYGTKSYASPIYAFDINGKKGPNKWGYDIYGVSFYGNSKNGITEFRNYVLAEKGGKYLEQRLEALGIK